MEINFNHIFVFYIYQINYIKQYIGKTETLSIILELDKETRIWDLYAHVEAQVKNMMSSLRAVSELQNPAIKYRHWQELMAETRVRRYNIILIFTTFHIYNRKKISLFIDNSN